MSDTTDSGFGFTAPSYSLNPTPTTPGLSVNTGNYTLGGSLTGDTGPQGPTFGNSNKGSYDFGGAYGFGPSDLGKPIDGPPSWNNPEVRFNLGTMFDEGNKLGLNLKNPDRFGPTSLQNNSMDNLSQAVNQMPQMQGIIGDRNPQENQGATGLFQDRNSLAYRLGLRDPGSAASRDFFSHETAAERDDRMGLVGDAIGSVGKSLISMAMPTPISMGLAAYRGYGDYQKNGDLAHALAVGAGGFGGYLGAAGNAVQGNYGKAASDLAGAVGLGGPVASAIGMGVDTANGKQVNPAQLGGLAGYFGGRQLGGPVGAVAGQYLGGSLGSMYNRKI